MTPNARIKRVYDPVERDDGYRVLIDHVWPRGVSRERAKLDEWDRELAPSDALRTWFDHGPERFEEFRDRYRRELAEHTDRIKNLHARAQRTGTIVYAARYREHNNAVVLTELVRDG